MCHSFQYDASNSTNKRICGKNFSKVKSRMVMCEGNGGGGVKIMSCSRNCVPNLEDASAFRLQLPLVWLVGTMGQAIWKLRIENLESISMK